jgi:hypothetical protein
MKKLRRYKQCAKCPWKKSTNPFEIPNGYSEEKHKNLKKTIANNNDIYQIAIESTMRVMACHESKSGSEAHCVGWLMNQLGEGNNILLRLQMRQYDLKNVKLDGPQHEKFEDTLPKRQRKI